MYNFTHRISRFRKKAFTLIEIMVATVIMVVLVALVIQITTEVLKVWSRSAGKLSANAEARIAMDLLTQDLETAVLRNNGKQWLRVEAPLDTGGGASLYTDQTVGLKLFSPALDRPDGAGDICAIGYRLAYQASYPGQQVPVYALYRRVIDPEDTFDKYLGPTDGDVSVQDKLEGNLWMDADILDESNYLAGNIVEFKVLVYEQPLPGLKLLGPVNASLKRKLDDDYAYGGPNDPATGEPIDLAVSRQTLLYADIILTVISDEGLDMLENIDKLTGMTPADVVAQHGEIYTRRVNFMARPL